MGPLTGRSIISSEDAIQNATAWSQVCEPACTVFEDESGFTIQMALPGLAADQINVEVEHGQLRVKGEWKHDASEGRDLVRA